MKKNAIRYEVKFAPEKDFKDFLGDMKTDLTGGDQFFKKRDLSTAENATFTTGKFLWVSLIYLTIILAYEKVKSNTLDYEQMKDMTVQVRVLIFEKCKLLHIIRVRNGRNSNFLTNEFI